MKKKSTNKSPVKKDPMKYIQGKAMGLTNKQAAVVAGYSPNTPVLRSAINKITVEEALALEGVDNSYIAKNLKNITENAEKPTAAGNQVVWSPDWQNRIRALENIIKVKGAFAPSKTNIDVNIEYKPFKEYTDEQLDKLIQESITPDEHKYGIIDVTPKDEVSN